MNGNNDVFSSSQVHQGQQDGENCRFKNSLRHLENRCMRVCPFTLHTTFYLHAEPYSLVLSSVLTHSPY